MTQSRVGYGRPMSSSFSEDQLQPGDTLDERGVDDVLDEGMSPPERPSPAVAHGITPAEDAAGETLDERIAQEEPDPAAQVDHTVGAQEAELTDPDGTDENADPSDGFEVGDERTGRLVEPEGGDADDTGLDAGIDGGAASAEEAAVHTVDEDQV
jgi:hypothetical protein